MNRPVRQDVHRVRKQRWKGETCLFCHNPPDSREDAFPKWMIREIGGRRRSFITTLPNGRTFSSGRPFKPKIACRTCNGGWMSILEKAAGKYLRKLMRGDIPVELSIKAQFIITSWSLKTAMVFDYAATEWGDVCYFSPAERQQLARSLKGSVEHPFPWWLRVWLARYDGTEGSTCTQYLTSGLGQATYGGQQSRVGITIPGHVATISARQFVTQVLTCRIPREHESAAWQTLGLHPKLDFSRFVREINPPHAPHVSWPPFEILKDTGTSLEDFAKRWPHGPIGPATAQSAS